jgi:serine transporter
MNSIPEVLDNTDPTDSSGWNRFDTMWVLGIYASAIGAGILYLPIKLGIIGFWPALILLILAFPMTYFSHRAATNFVLSGTSRDRKSANIVETAREHFGPGGATIVTLIYFIAMFPAMTIFSVTLTNTAINFIEYQLHLPAPARSIVSIVIILALMASVKYGHSFVVKVIALMAYPFIGVLMLLGVILISKWSPAFFETMHVKFSAAAMGTSLWTTLPVMVIAFGQISIISAFVVAQRNRYPNSYESKSRRTLLNANILIVFSSLFFVMSCIFSLTPAELVEANRRNISVVSFIADKYNEPLIATLATFIVFVGIAKAFLAHYIAVDEGFVGIGRNVFSIDENKFSSKNISRLGDLIIIATCWLGGTLNPNALGMIGGILGPLVTVLLFIVPMYGIYRVPALARFRRQPSNLFVVVIGVLSVASTLVPLFSRH